MTPRKLFHDFIYFLKVALNTISEWVNKFFDTPIQDIVPWIILTGLVIAGLSIICLIFDFLKGLLRGFKGRSIEKLGITGRVWPGALEFGYKIGIFFKGDN